MLDEIWREASIFHNVLQSFRVRRGKSWTQKETAKLLNVEYGKYIGWENGENIPSREELKKIVAVFRLNQEEEEALYLAAWQAPPKICHLPFSRNPFFTGRKSHLEQLRQFLQANGSVALTQPVSISGLGGIGKSQLALEYAYRCFPKVYRAVFWVNAADRRTLRAGYYALAHRLKLPDIDKRNPKQCIQAVKQWLVDHTNWLLIMDNADDLPLARSFFPEGYQGHILLTTRSPFAGKIGARQLEIDKMEPEEGLDFLLRRTDRLEAEDMRESALQLVELLDGHPLALDQAGAYIEETRISFTDYIHLYNEQRRLFLEKYGALESEHSDHPETVVVTFELCFAAARERHRLADEILNFCAFLSPDDIPVELFQHDISFKVDRDTFNGGIAALQRYSLIKRNTQEKTFSMHRLVQAVFNDAMPPDLQKQWRERVVRALNAAFPAPEFSNWRQCERLVSHVLACAAWANEITPKVAFVVLFTFGLFHFGLFNKAGSYLLERGQYSEAEMLLSRALSICKQLFGAASLETASSLHDLALLYSAQCKYSQAEHLYQQALEIQEKIYGEHLFRLLGSPRPDIVDSLHNLAVLYIMQGKFEQAEPLLAGVQSIQEMKLGTEHPDVIMSLSNLAAFYIGHAWRNRRS
jgi:tetratricopeptide (TPR) repeat protein